MVVNEDGSLSRISNWKNMTPQEQAVTLKRIGQRNQERLARLRAQGQ